MKFLLFIALGIMLLFSTVLYAGWFSKSGAELFLSRQGFETHRAVFDEAGDCQLIADTMNKAEPNVRWFCK